MTESPSFRCFHLAASCDAALRTVRKALERHGLRAAAEVNVHSRILRELGAGVAPCVVLYVDDPAVLLEAVVFHRGAPLLIPQPLVITGARHGAEVHLRAPESLAGQVPESVRDPLFGLLRRMTTAMESVAEEAEPTACPHPVLHG